MAAIVALMMNGAIEGVGLRHQAVRFGNTNKANSNIGTYLGGNQTPFVSSTNGFCGPRLSAVMQQRREMTASVLSRRSYAYGGVSADSESRISQGGTSHLKRSAQYDSEKVADEDNHLLFAEANQCSDDAMSSMQKGLIVESAISSSFLRLNVGGAAFMIKRETIQKRGVGRLLFLVNAKDASLAEFDAYLEQSREYYFERPPALFHIIYQFYLTGQIHQPSHLCPTDILDELDYWGIVPDDYLAPCCCVDEKGDDSSSIASEEKPNLFKSLYLGEVRRKIWNVVEEPTSSILAQIFATLSVLFVLISISGLVLGSLPELQIPIVKNVTEGQIVDMEPLPIIGYVEYVCIVWFTLEYVIKMIVTAERRKTFFQLLNIIDLMAILPFVIEMLLLVAGVSTDQLRDLKGAFLVIRILRVLRVIRVLKLGRYSSGLQMFGKTLKASFRQLGMMAMVVLTGVIFFSTLVYFLEKDEPNSGFSSIPAACWWCIVTMTTVGYGDLTPVTVPGKLVATGAIACGVLVLALPITIIVDNFMKVAEGERDQPSGVASRFGSRPQPASGPFMGKTVTRQVSMKKPLTQDTIC